MDVVVYMAKVECGGEMLLVMVVVNHPQIEQQRSDSLFVILIWGSC